MKSANKTTRREALNKYVRAKAHREGTLFKDALDNVVANENGTGAFVPVIAGRLQCNSKPGEIRERLRVERFVKASDSRSEIIPVTYKDPNLIPEWVLSLMETA